MCVLPKFVLEALAQSGAPGIEKVNCMEWSDYKARVKEALEASKFDIAETTLLQALQWVKDTSGSNERLCLCLDQLAWIYVNIKDLDRAAACYKESLEVKTSILGEQNPIVARACKKLATVVYMQKRYDLAEKYSKDALNIFKTTLGVDHEETQQTLADLVSLLRKMNRNFEANILQNMGKPTAAAPPEVQEVQQGYSMGQTFLRIKVCANCSLPYDGDQCLRCTEGRILAQQKTPPPAQQAQGPQTAPFNHQSAETDQFSTSDQRSSGSNSVSSDHSNDAGSTGTTDNPSDTVDSHPGTNQSS